MKHSSGYGRSTSSHSSNSGGVMVGAEMHAYCLKSLVTMTPKHWILSGDECQDACVLGLLTKRKPKLWTSRGEKC
jgi:hypothetical protein